MLSWIFKLNKYIFYFFIRPPPVLKYPDSKSILFHLQEVPYGQIFNFFQGDALSARSSAHTIASYSTYISA